MERESGRECPLHGLLDPLSHLFADVADLVLNVLGDLFGQFGIAGRDVDRAALARDRRRGGSTGKASRVAAAR